MFRLSFVVARAVISGRASCADDGNPTSYVLHGA